MEQVIVEPPLYLAQEHIFSIDFHPKQDIMCCSLISGQINLLHYNSEEVKEIKVLDYHTDSCRSCVFSPEGNLMATGSKDQSIGLVNNQGNLQYHKQNAHEHPINIVRFLTEDLLISGDDEGLIKVWDLRTNQSVYSAYEHSEAITDLDFTKDLLFLLSSSTDGQLGVFDLRKNQNQKEKLYAMSDNMETDLLQIQIMKNEKFVVTSSNEGPLFIFKWDRFGDCCDRLVGHGASVDALCKIDENTLLTGCDDGKLRGVSIFPNKIIQTIGTHSDDDQIFPIQKIAVSRCGNIAATCSHDESIQFYDLSYFMNKSYKRKQLNEDEIDNIIQNNQNMDIESNSDSDDFDSDNSDDDSSENIKQKKQKQTKLKKINYKQIKADQQKEQKKQFFQDI